MTPLSPFAADWPAISALLDEALGLPASAHAAWLDGLSGERAAHAQALRTLLAHRASVETDDFLREVPRLDLADAEPPGSGLVAGSHVGAYRLISELGRGGMAAVWLADRSDGLMKRRVALKLPRIVWGDAFAERLAREREILATLEHEHIARLYDAGVDALGRPFLAMEYVEGESIDSYCLAHAPGVHERIGLLRQVMTAVAHAHARLVVHRDLKPSNILVTRDGQVKLLDFGIAKLLEGERTRATALTELGGRALTLDYASPEQIRGEPLGTASDIYSMAVVAYEVLAGTRPYRLKRASVAELEEAIASADPPLASDSATDRRLARQLRGDLDSILNKALKKAAGERYATMDAFAQDLQRHLDGKPVQARPDGLAYRAAKFVHRHRLQVAAATGVALALVAGTAVALWQAREAARAAATAEAVQGFIESVFDANTSDQADPVAARATTARELLDRGAERVDRELASAPEAQLRLYKLMAQMYVGMALNEPSIALERRSLALSTRLYGAHSDQALRSAVEIGLDLSSLGRRDEALTVLLQADAAARSRRRDDDAVRMMIDTALAMVYVSADPPLGLARARSAAALARAQGVSADGIEALFTLGENARKAGALAEARQALVDAAAWIDLQGKTGELHMVLSALGAVQNDLGQIEAAGATLRRAVALSERRNEPAFRATRFKLARYQYENRLLHEALAAADADVAWARRAGPEEGEVPSAVMANYGRTLVAYGDAARGLAALDEARALLPRATTERMGPLLAARADALVALGRLDEARADVERALATTARAGGATVEAVRAVRRRYWLAAGRPEQALQDFRDHPQQAGETDTAPLRLRRQAEEAQLLLAAGRDAEARSVATAGLAALDRLPERRFFGVAEAQMTAVLGQALLREGRAAEALPVLQKSLTLHLVQYDPVHSPAVANARRALAEAEDAARRAGTGTSPTERR
ncbi:protein kinase domain-containing protein [Rubrivivax gelatinosus]|uniref:Protein kinase domain-containing protein n=1 Tax=Rubrivivax gelatinosus TaxID=28068 RepID=A0ABS1DW56_RUBGE|nr:hypothetical protein [Rubrivivax gelatinosus]